MANAPQTQTPFDRLNEADNAMARLKLVISLIEDAAHGLLSGYSTGEEAKFARQAVDTANNIFLLAETAERERNSADTDLHAAEDDL